MQTTMQKMIEWLDSFQVVSTIGAIAKATELLEEEKKQGVKLVFSGMKFMA